MTEKDFFTIGNYGNDNYKEVTLNYLKRHEKPIVLFGAGEVAGRVISVLDENGIVPDYQIVDDKYVNKTKFSYPNITYEEFMKSFYGDKASLIGGMKDYIYVDSISKKLGCEPIFLDKLFETETISKEYFEKNCDSYFSLYKYLVDQKSKDTMISYLKANISSNPRYIFDVFDRGPQYFSLSEIGLTDHETFVDCGAFNGDTIESFLKIVNRQYRKIYAFEADKNNFISLDTNISEPDIIKINKGVYSHNDGIKFISSETTKKDCIRSMSMVSNDTSKGSYYIDTCKIDDVLRKENVSLIRMDIEGSEVPALEGAFDTISRCKPKLAISAYHKKDDLITIPSIIKKADDSYKFALRAYCPWSEELVLYAYH